MFDFIKFRKIFYLFSALFFIGAIASLILWQLNFGIDFKGGSLLSVEFSKSTPSNAEITDAISEFNLGEVVVQKSGDYNAMIRFKDVEEEVHQNIFDKLATLDEGLTELGFEQVGPAIGNELKRDATYAVVTSLIAILLFISYSFRKVSKRIRSYKYGVAAVIALFHDVVITLGVFAVLGKFKGVEIGLPFMAAFLTVLGYSVNDTIVVFDRIRENLLRSYSEGLDEICNKSLNQTLVRSISTSLVTLVALLSVYFFGGETIKYFSLALIVGITAGTYSSILIATPILYDWEMFSRWRKNK